MLKRYRAAILMAGSVLSGCFPIQTGATALRYTWMLPKTILDATVIYNFQSCGDKGLRAKVSPTLTSRIIPDMRVGQKELDPASLQSFSQDKGISLQTFGGSRILNSIGSQPTSETGQIVGNIIGGVAKLVAVGVGVSPALTPPAAPGSPPQPVCATGDGSAMAVAKQIDDLKSKIVAYQREVAAGTDETTQKKNTAAISAAQALITTLQDQLTITIKTAIDPGFTQVLVDADAEAGQILNQNGDGSIANSGLVAKLCPSRRQLEKAKWFSNLDALFTNGRNACDAIPTLKVNVYLDFPLAHSTMYFSDHQGPYKQTDVPVDAQYRDVGYIPVNVWLELAPVV